MLCGREKRRVEGGSDGHREQLQLISMYVCKLYTVTVDSVVYLIDLKELDNARRRTSRKGREGERRKRRWKRWR